MHVEAPRLSHPLPALAPPPLAARGCPSVQLASQLRGPRRHPAAAQQWRPPRQAARGGANLLEGGSEAVVPAPSSLAACCALDRREIGSSTASERLHTQQYPWIHFIRPKPSAYCCSLCGAWDWEHCSAGGSESSAALYFRRADGRGTFRKGRELFYIRSSTPINS